MSSHPPTQLLSSRWKRVSLTMEEGKSEEFYRESPAIHEFLTVDIAFS